MDVALLQDDMFVRIHLGFLQTVDKVTQSDWGAGATSAANAQR